ncbi:MAG: aminotransferase class V-fold PLP-dependent enzyme [Gemmatimonadetes bacterium]|nr:aminotransferase class V-fold PLP-dependent enzyme [Gemmatimonadota bacterium]
MDLQQLRRQFPVTDHWTYLNHAAVAPISLPVQRAMEHHLRDVAEHGLAHITDWHALYADARRSVGRLIGARSDEIAFLKNTTDGLIAVALGVQWRPGDSVVVAEREFPANVYPWLWLADKGVTIRKVPERDGRLLVEDFADAIDSHTRVLTVSSVEFFSGFRNDLAALGRLCRERDILFVVDGIQSVGALHIDVEKMGIDCLAADAHKWLMGPEGCAIFFCSGRAMRHVHPAAIGWASVQTSHDFLDYDTALHQDARRFETGTQNTVGIAGTKAAVDLLLELGMDTVEARILSLTDRLVQGLTPAGYEVLSSRLPDEKSGIVTCRRPESESSTQIAARLHEAGVMITDRGGWLRLSPHVYNTEEEIDQALALMDC